MISFLTDFSQLFEKAIYFAKIDSYYLLPVIGSIQIFLIGVFFKKIRLIYLSIILFIVFFSLFPLVKLIPNLGSDAFSEFQKLNFSEVYFYIKTLNFFAGWTNKHFILWIFIVFLYINFISIVYFLSKKIKFFNFIKINYSIILGLLIIPTSINLYKVFNLYNSSVIENENQLKNIDYNLNSLIISQEQSNDLSVFFYIGEATSRLHWSLYEYFRPTNNKLEKFNKQNSLIIFDNIYSTHTHTSPSLLDTLTIKKENINDDNLKITSEYERFTLTDILGSKSIETKLYSSQAKSGSWNSASSIIFKNANKKIYSSKYNLGNANNINTEKPYDHEFLVSLVNDIKTDTSKKNFYVFHSYAGHGNYKKNIPKQYHKKIDDFYSRLNDDAIFGKEYKKNQREFLEDYDSAMNYVSDNITFSLKEILDLKKPIIFIYTSDHGESPLTGRAHDSSRYLWEMSSVPFVIFFNKQAKLKYEDLFHELQKRSLEKSRDILSNFPSLVMEIFGLKIFDKNYKLTNSSSCKFGDGNCFQDYHVIRNQLNSLGVVHLKYPIEKNTNFIDNTDRGTAFANMKNYLHKIQSKSQICSHRTNSIARFIRFNAILDCMEIDVLINDDYLDVAHSKDLSTSLKLKDLIKIQKSKENTLWLDVKNINNINQCNKLTEILQNIKFENNKINFFIEFPSKVIEKISELNDCISNIKLLNVPVSFYMPNDTHARCLEQEERNYFDKNSCQYSDELLKKIDQTGLFTDISFDYINYDFLKNSNYINSFSLNTWHIPDEKIISITNKNFRLIIPFNDKINYN